MWQRKNCSFWAISSFVTMFSKSGLLQRRLKASIWGKVLTISHIQTTFENFVAEGKNSHDEPFLLLPQCFQFYSKVLHSFIEFFHSFEKSFWKYLFTTLFKSPTLIYRMFPYFCQDVLKDVFWSRTVVCEKGLDSYKLCQVHIWLCIILNNIYLFSLV